MPVIITSKKDGFRRAGMAHPATPTTYPDDTFTEDQLKALLTEPMLVVGFSGVDLASGPDSTSVLVVNNQGDIISRIMSVLPDLGEGDMKKDGTPGVKAVEAALGENVSAGEVAEAWTKYKAADDDGAEA